MTDEAVWPAPAPDFVMVGGKVHGKVVLLASRELVEVELREEAEKQDHEDRMAALYGLPRQPPKIRHYLTAEVKSWTQVWADSYPEAFQILFEQWTPAGQPELPGQEAIER